MTDIHGGNIYSREVKYDFSANINPLGMPESAVRAVTDSAHLWERYPDPNCTELVNALAQKYSVTSGQLAVGNGAADLIYRIVNALKPRKCLVTAPAFSEYEKALSESGCKITYYELCEEDDFEVKEDICGLIDENTDLVFITSPNNPTGRTVSSDIIRKLLEKCAENSCILVCDECFIGFTDHPSENTALRFINPSLIILNAFTKIYAMPGLRLGYAVCGSVAAAERIRSTGQYWSVSVPAQAAGIAALACEDYPDKTRRLVSEEREFLVNALEGTGIKVFRSDANFILVKTSSDLYNALLSEGILIRCCSSYRGLNEEYFRIAVRTHEENVKLAEAVRRCVSG